MCFNYKIGNIEEYKPFDLYISYLKTNILFGL